MTLPDRLRADLAHAIRARDRTAVTALRTALAAFSNAEAPPAPGVPAVDQSAPPVVGRLVEHARVELSEADLEAILRFEIADREHTIGQYESGDRGAEADALRGEIAVLARYLG